ncbi:hypothetical protein CYMTET_14593 [Cymbomonas tetramitiformis]|uniref:UBX domain-containing protein n=1 Tax=Cymbomonas tetramitiformis TaxID=36881 RepID=A0AAE0LA75_9CHLO|nr:hypothetical protein CYMTET_14593 [Cymbomonas tetramitiformis]
MSDAEQDEKIGTLASITGAEASAARNVLEATGWDLEAAINLYYASQMVEQDGSSDSHTSQPAPTSSNPAPLQDPEYVRPPDAVRTESLYGDESYQAARYGFRSQQMQAAPQAVVDPFRDFSQESGSGFVPRTHTAAVDRGESAGGQQGLAGLFRPPKEILSTARTLEEAKSIAGKQGRWLIVNIQSTSEFSSHRLNRDTWSNDFVKDTISANFTFWQIDDHTEEGNKVKTFYRVFTTPITLVLDPITGASMKTWNGFIDPDRLMEDLMTYMDRGPLDGGALPPAKRHQSDGSISRSSSTAGVTGSAPQCTEDEELARALAMSMEDNGGSAPASDDEEGMDVQDDTDAEPAISAEERREAAAEALPEEPPAADPLACRVAVRFPHGARQQRRFLKTEVVEVLHHWCITIDDEAASGRPFQLATIGMPGQPSEPLTDPSVSLQAAGVVGGMLSFNWI